MSNELKYGFAGHVLILMVGLPYSGKTTAAVELSHARHAAIVSPDAIRMAMTGQRFLKPLEPLVWQTARIMVRALFLAGHKEVIVDACHTTAKRRAFWIAEGEEWEIEVCELGASADECLERAKAAGDVVILESIRRMAEHRQGRVMAGPEDESDVVLDWYPW